MKKLDNFSAQKLKVVSNILLLAVLLTGCGFKLRGQYLLPPELQTLYVSSIDSQGELTRALKQNLALNQVKVLKVASAGAAQLHLLKDTLDRRTLSVFPNGQVAEYELIYTVRYQLLFAEQAPREYSFELYRDYQDDPDQALAKSRELSLLLGEMRQLATDRILRNMASFQG
jgi:LPS-assembly lipoprotein